MVTETMERAPRAAGRLTPELISARMERLPFSRYHFRILSIVGACSFFDAFDSLMISYVLPVLVVAWHFTPSDTGLMISGAYVGQVLGAWGFSWAAERVGRVKALQWTVGLMAVMAGLCAFASSFPILLTLRFLQGLGLGGEVPVGAAYINEFTNARTRGRVVFGLQVFYAFAVVVTAIIGAYVVPHWGWQAMFLLGLVPALIAIVVRRIVPELPRWLAQRVSLEAADRTTTAIEASGDRQRHHPFAAGARQSFRRSRKSARASASCSITTYRWRTFSVWAMCFCYDLDQHGDECLAADDLPHHLSRAAEPCALHDDRADRRFVLRRGRRHLLHRPDRRRKLLPVLLSPPARSRS